MAQNSDGSVTLKTTGKVATDPSGTGTGQVKPPAAKSSEKSPKVVPVKGRGATSRTQAGAGKAAGKRR